MYSFTDWRPSAHPYFCEALPLSDISFIAICVTDLTLLLFQPFVALVPTILFPLANIMSSFCASDRKISVMSVLL